MHRVDPGVAEAEQATAGEEDHDRGDRGPQRARAHLPAGERDAHLRVLETLGLPHRQETGNRHAPVAASASRLTSLKAITTRPVAGSVKRQK